MGLSTSGVAGPGQSKPAKSSRRRRAWSARMSISTIVPRLTGVVGLAISGESKP